MVVLVHGFNSFDGIHHLLVDGKFVENDRSAIEVDASHVTFTTVLAVDGQLLETLIYAYPEYLSGDSGTEVVDVTVDTWVKQPLTNNCVRLVNGCQPVANLTFGYLDATEVANLAAKALNVCRHVRVNFTGL